MLENINIIMSILWNNILKFGLIVVHILYKFVLFGSNKADFRNIIVKLSHVREFFIKNFFFVSFFMKAWGSLDGLFRVVLDFWLWLKLLFEKFVHFLVWINILINCIEYYNIFFFFFYFKLAKINNYFLVFFFAYFVIL